MRKRVTFESSSDDSETDENGPSSRVKKKLTLQSIGLEPLFVPSDLKLRTPDYTTMKIESSDESESEQFLNQEVESPRLSAFSDRSIGFQMMKRMGFSEGETLGVRGGIKEPIIPVARTRRLGLGATRRGATDIFDIDENSDSVKAYHGHRKGNLARSRNSRTVERLQKFCFEESGDSSRPRDQVNVMWRLLATPEPHEENKAEAGKIEAKGTADVQEEDSEDSWNHQDLEAKLEALVQHSRLVFLYCIYCSIRYASAEDMASCPGPREEDHVL